jgi:Ca2+-binding EF-hand superfamily protein
MLLALGAASSAIDALLGLTSPKQAKPAGSNGQSQANLFAFQADATSSTGSTAGSTAGGRAQISPETMSALLAAQGQASQGATTTAPASRADALKNLFGKIDADGDGKITKLEFEKALGAGGTNLAKADNVFGKLDKNGDGSVTLDEMSSALKGGHGPGHHHTAGRSGDSSDPWSQALQGASTTTVTNADGSTTTSLTYADGSKVTTTRPAATGGSGAATSSYNFIEQLIQRQAKANSPQASSSLSVSV